MNAVSDIADAKPRALVSPSADFWLVGGASLAAFSVTVIVTQAAGIQIESRLAFWLFCLSFLVNDPHFFYSYLLFYRGFWRRLTAPGAEKMTRLRNVVAGIVVPVVMTILFVYAFVRPDPKYVDWAFSAMIFSVGWHYVKQGYGVLITLSLYEGVFYNSIEKRILWLNAYIVWGFTWVSGMIVHNSPHIIDPSPYGAHAVTVMLPQWFSTPALWGIIAMLPAAVVLLNHWLYDKKGISGNAVLGYVCAMVWIMMPFVNSAFLIFVPFFHSLQYLPFVYKVKKVEFDATRHAPTGNSEKSLRQAIWRTAGFTLAGFVLGAVFFELLPKYIDRQAAEAHMNLHPSFFFLMFPAFINIHHFFMDSAYWRRDNAEVQRNLFRAP